jgi:hypothetical protein
MDLLRIHANQSTGVVYLTTGAKCRNSLLGEFLVPRQHFHEEFSMSLKKFSLSRDMALAIECPLRGAQD